MSVLLDAVTKFCPSRTYYTRTVSVVVVVVVAAVVFVVASVLC